MILSLAAGVVRWGRQGGGESRPRRAAPEPDPPPPRGTRVTAGQRHPRSVLRAERPIDDDFWAVESPAIDVGQ